MPDSTRLEILAQLSFEQYLKHLEQDATVDPANRSSPTFHSNVRNLEERFFELVRSRGQFGAYESRVRALCDRLLPIKASGGADEAVKLLGQYASLSPTTTVLPATTRTGTTRTATATADPGAPPRSGRTTRERQFKPISVSAATTAQLEKQGEQQEALTDELAELSSSLKDSVKHLSTAVGQRNAAIDQAQVGLEESVDKTKSRVTAIEKTRKSMRLNSCLSILVLLAVMGGFAAMVVFIRVTRFVGYKSSHKNGDKSGDKSEL